MDYERELKELEKLERQSELAKKGIIDDSDLDEKPYGEEEDANNGK